MTSPREQAQSQLLDQVDRLRSMRVIDVIERTVAAIWMNNVDRYEPEEFGDTQTSLGLQTSQNIAQMLPRAFAEERYAGKVAVSLGEDPEDEIVDDPHGEDARAQSWAEPAQDGTDGSARFTLPRNSLRLTVADTHIHFAKAHNGTDRQPQWDVLARSDWRTSQTRHGLAAANNNALSLSPAERLDDDQLPLYGPGPSPAGTIKRYLLVWTGDLTTGLTSAWLTVPVLGPDGFAAKQGLWWHDTRPQTQAKPSTSTGAKTPFDAIEQPAPAVKLRKLPGSATGTAGTDEPS